MMKLGNMHTIQEGSEAAALRQRSQGGGAEGGNIAAMLSKQLQQQGLAKAKGKGNRAGAAAGGAKGGKASSLAGAGGLVGRSYEGSGTIPIGNPLYESMDGSVHTSSFNVPAATTKADLKVGGWVLGQGGGGGACGG